MAGARNEGLPGRGRLADLALEGLDHEAARDRYEEAWTIFRRVGDILGQAVCIAQLAEIARRRSDHDGACARYEKALPLFRRIGETLGEASCLQALGDIDCARGDLASAKARFCEALGLYSRIPDFQLIGSTLLRIAPLEADPEAKRQRVEAAREAWTRIKRPDLVEELEQEFGADLSGTAPTSATGPTPGGGESI